MMWGTKVNKFRQLMETFIMQLHHHLREWNFCLDLTIWSRVQLTEIWVQCKYHKKSSNRESTSLHLAPLSKILCLNFTLYIRAKGTRNANVHHAKNYNSLSWSSKPDSPVNMKCCTRNTCKCIVRLNPHKNPMPRSITWKLLLFDSDWVLMFTRFLIILTYIIIILQTMSSHSKSSKLAAR